MLQPLAHSAEEIELYLRLHPCECGTTEVRHSTARMVDGGWILRYTDDCAGCGRPRALEFRLADQPDVPTGAVWSDSADPSELLDAGEWLWVADSYSSGPADLAELPEGEHERSRAELRAAVAALDEVLKFLPEGASEVPESAFRSDRGRRTRQRDPGRFSRLRLLGARDAYARLLAESER